MKKLIIMSYLLIGIGGIHAATDILRIEGDDKKEINHRDLPEEVRNYIVDQFPGAEIIKSFITLNGGKETGFLVELKAGESRHSLYFNKQGIPKSKNKS